jgi:hypothetical protein
MRRWHVLRPLTEARERHAELTIQLAQASRYRTPSSTLAELSREHGRLSQLLTPLEESLREVESIEGLLVGALDEVPPDLEPDARAQYERYRERLLLALFWLSEEDALCFAVQELDDRRVLHEFLLPLLRFAQAQGWEILLHFDRGARESVVWPKLAERRWGPPIPGAVYLADVPAERPSDGVLLRVRGAGAGALLSFYLGRLRYESPGDTPPGELWCRPLLGRYDVREEDWNTARLSPVIDREVGRRQGIAWQEDRASALGRAQLLERYATLFFTPALEKALAGGAFLPPLPKDD